VAISLSREIGNYIVGKHEGPAEMIVPRTNSEYSDDGTDLEARGADSEDADE
jgi:hypothetical protein